MEKQILKLPASSERTVIKIRKTKTVSYKGLRILLGVISLGLSYVLVQEVSNLYDMYCEINEEITCLYLKTPYYNILHNNTILPTKSIFMVVPFCSGDLSIRQSCAIESAAIAHPNWQINVIHAGFIADGHTQYKVMKHYENIKYWKVNIEEYAEGTPLENLVKNKLVKLFCMDVKLVTNVIKYLTLYRWPGMFIDLQVIVGQSLEFLPKNWVVQEDQYNIGEALVALSEDEVGRDIAHRAVREIEEHYFAWCNREETMRKVLKYYCTTKYVSEMTSLTCNGIRVFRPEFFYPLPKHMAYLYFKEVDIPVSGALTYYLWGEGSDKLPPPPASPYNMLAKEHCPRTHGMAKSHRGFSDTGIVINKN